VVLGRIGGQLNRMNRSRARTGLPAYFVLPAGFAALLVAGAVAAGLHGGLPATGVLILAAAVVLVISATAELLAAPVIGLIGWLTVAGFSGPPYAQLRMTGPVAARAAVAMACCALVGAAAGLVVRDLVPSFRLWIVNVRGEQPPAGAGRRLARTARATVAGAAPWPAGPIRAGMGLRGRRQAAGVLLIAGLPLITVALAAARGRLDLSDDLLIYLVAVVAVAIVGGFWPAVLAAITASLLLNWYFTKPLHTLTIAEPRNMLALLLFVTVAVTVSSVVHLAARRQVQAALSADEAASLLGLAQTVLGGADTPTAVLAHLTSSWGGRAELAELVRDQWVSVAVSGSAAEDAVPTQVTVSDTVALIVAGQSRPMTARLLDGFAAQAGAALDRDRLRTQAAQAEALAEGNRMRTALLAAVSHDLRTPLASIKASVSTLRQTDVEWTPADEAALLATIEDGADRLDALIGNLLDMSRLATGSLQPFLRPTSVEEVAPAALLGLAPASSVRMAVPDDLPLVRTDPVLLERVLANLFANALAHSPDGRSPVLRARPDSGSVLLEVCDHGPGVPDGFKQRMFEPFERLGDRPSGTGVGLGLAVAKGFLEAMGGSVVALDTPGGGLTVQVTLPVAAAPAASAAAAEQ
jgi:two-component system sensor histidine kinase KdpD